MELRNIEFKGVLQSPESFKEYFLIYDCLGPLEWRINAFLSPKLVERLPFLNRYFDRVVIRDDLFNLSEEKKEILNNIQSKVYLNITNNFLQNFEASLKYRLSGIDEVIMPLKDFENSFDQILNLTKENLQKNEIRRMDIQLPTSNHVIDEKKFKVFGDFCSENNIQFEITTQYDDPSLEWYSRPGIEEFVDADPIPYLEDGGWYSVTADALFYKDGFHLNEQRFPVGDSFYDGENPIELIYKMLSEKIKKYEKHSLEIKEKEGNIYYNYFLWVAKTLKINSSFSFIPSFCMRPTTKFYKALVNDKYFLSHKMGLVNQGSQIKPLVEFK